MLNIEKSLNISCETRTKLYECLNELHSDTFKTFYCLFVHYFIKYNHFISKQNVFNLWCELNLLCHDLDESFPDPFDDFDIMTSYCKSYRFYFIDILPISLIAANFAEYIDKDIEIVINIVRILIEKDLTAACAFANTSFNINEDENKLATEIQTFINCCK